jgi:hypothetical protein
METTLIKSLNEFDLRGDQMGQVINYVLRYKVIILSSTIAERLRTHALNLTHSYLSSYIIHIHVAQHA